jgi:hypothetical protein
MAYAQATRNSIETPIITANNTQEHAVIKVIHSPSRGSKESCPNKRNK